MIARGRRAVQGFTILEVMIFLAISSLLFVSAIWVVGGKQKYVQFSQGVRDINSKIQDTINDVATGYFPKNDNFNCTALPAGPQTYASSPTTTQGTNEECVFLGKAIEFTDNDNFYIYTITGRHKSLVGNDITSYAEAFPTVAVGGGLDLTVTDRMRWSITAQSLNDLSAPANRGTIVFLSSLPQFTAGSLESGKQSVVYAVVPFSDLTDDQATTITKINNMTVAGLNVNPPDGVRLCVADDEGRKATITIGGSNQIASARLDIDGGGC